MFTSMWSLNRTFGYLTIGVSFVAMLFTLVTISISYVQMMKKYQVEFTPIPHYMIGSKDIIGYNSKGEKIILKNQTAYYKAVECNRTADDRFYDVLGTCADMNGDVGKEWLALYVAKNEAMDPILAKSLKAVTGSSDIPSGYSVGIHMFGSANAFNLNDNRYDWDKGAKSAFVYFKTDDGALNETGTSFTGGTLAVTGGVGLIIGALATALITKSSKAKKEINAEA